MSINIFQFLKQGTSLNNQTIKKIKELQATVTHTPRTPNSLYFQTGKFKQSDDERQDRVKGNEWEELDEDKMRHKHNQQIQKSIDLRKKYKIKVDGTDIPFPVENFGALINKYKLNSKLIDKLAKKGFEQPTPVQMQAIPSLLEERNVLVTAPTGTGKTITYLLPIIQGILNKRGQEKSTTKSKTKKNKEIQNHNDIEAIIISPQHELSIQIVNEIETLIPTKDEIPKHQIITYGQASSFTQQQKQRIKNEQQIGVNIVVASPQTFLNLFNSSKSFSKLKFIILDECDKYFEESFLEQIRALLQIFATIKSKPVYGLFSATIQHPVEQLLKSELLDDAIRIEIGGKNKVMVNIEQSIEYCTNEYGKILEIKNMIGQNKFIPPVLIFVQQKSRVKQLLFQIKKIMKNGPAGMDISKKIDALSGEKSKQQRKDVLERFEKGNIWVLITTDVIARGIDFSHVNLVINYDFPNTMLTYIHRIGRTGRAQRKGKAVTLFTDEDKPVVKSLANLLAASGCSVPGWILQLPNPDRKLKKKLEKYPTKRLPVGVADARDKNFDNELNKMQKVWQKKKERAIEKQDKEKAERENEESSEWIQA